MLNEKYTNHAILIKNEIILRPVNLDNDSITSLANHYGLSMIQMGNEQYFAGSTVNILKFLTWVLSEGYDVREFRVSINSYKTLLVIST